MIGILYNYSDIENDINMTFESLNRFEELSAVEMFFEASQKTQITNQAVQQESKNYIGMAITKLKNAISSVINYISDFINRIFMSKDEVAKFEMWKRKMEKNPEFKGKKLTITNWKAINKVYGEESKKMDAALKQIDSMNESQAEAFANKFVAESKKRIMSAKNGAQAVVTMEFALNAAESSKDIAIQIKKALDNDQSIMEYLEKTVSKREADKFKRQIGLCASKVRILNHRTWMYKDQAKGMSDVVEQTFNSFANMFKVNVEKENGKVKKVSIDTSKETNKQRLKDKRIVDRSVGVWNATTGNNDTTLTAGVKAMRAGMDAKKKVDSAKRTAKWLTT